MLQEEENQGQEIFANETEKMPCHSTQFQESTQQNLLDGPFVIDADYFEEDEEDLQRRKIAKEIEENEEPIVQDPQIIRDEMAKIYGQDGAKEILALETSMQLKFERMRDKHKSQIWPCLPLNMKFD